MALEAGYLGKRQWGLQGEGLQEGQEVPRQVIHVNQAKEGGKGATLKGTYCDGDAISKYGCGIMTEQPADDLQPLFV
jgi:hypothetical protein